MTDPAELAELDNLFDHHPPNGFALARHERVRSSAKRLASELLRTVPKSTERDNAIDHVRAAMMWANAAIACHGDPPAPTDRIDTGYGH